MSENEVKSVRDDSWLVRVEDAPECDDCEEQMYERDSEPAGRTPTTPTFEVLFECPSCGSQVRATRRRE